MLNSAFAPRIDKKVFPGIETGETDYIDRKIYLEFVQTGIGEDGKAIGSVQPVVKETKTNIEALINSHKNECGVKALVALYLKTGDASLFNQRTPLPDGDYTDIQSVGDVMNELDPELQALGLDSLVGLSKDQLIEVIKNIQAKNEPVIENSEVKENE